MDKRAVMDALDRAITNVAIKEYLSLRETKSNHVEVAQSIENALRAFVPLQVPSGAQPDYDDDWIALFYLLWYQPRQINLAYSLIKETLRQAPHKNPFLKPSCELHVVDFGGGSLAVQFAVVLATADAFEENEVISGVHVDSIDSSEAMLRLGEASWDEFEKIVDREPGFESLRRAMQVLTWDTHTQLSDKIEAIPGTDCWLSALHAVYQESVDPLAESLAYLKDRLNPDLGYLTSHYSKGPLVRQVSPFIADTRYTNYPFSSIERQFSGELPVTSAFRRAVSYVMLENPRIPDIVDGLREYEVGVSFVREYLNNPVTWGWAREVSIVYERQ